MPVLIQEVVIRATVTERKPPCNDPVETPESKATAGTAASTTTTEQIAEQIFEILKAKRER